MKTTRVFAISLFMFIAIALISCGKGGDGGIFLPDLTKTWTNTADNTNTFDFFNFPANVSTGNFEGNEHTSGGGLFHFTGSFNNASIQFTYDSGTKSGKSYSGTINSVSTVMSLSSSTLVAITLRKN